MPFQNYLPLVIFVTVATMSPGGATTLATASGAHFGFRRSLPYMAGITAGLGSMAAAAASGLVTTLATKEDKPTNDSELVPMKEHR